MKTCLRCAASFTPQSNRQKYCSYGCRRPRRICEGCGSSFNMKPNSTGRWCSNSCSLEARRLPECRLRPCVVCKADFKPRSAAQKYCSKPCGTIANQRPERACSVCRKPYRRRSLTDTCSKTCAATYRRRDADGRPCERCQKTIPWPDALTRRFCSLTCRRTPVGTERVDTSGYVHLYVGKDHVMANRSGWAQQHRAVLAESLGRRLEQHESVHHINGNRADNRLENLQLRSGKHGKGVVMRCCDCGSANVEAAPLA